MFIQVNHIKINKHHIRRSTLYVNTSKRGGLIALSYQKLDDYTHKLKTYNLPLRVYDDCKNINQVISIAKRVLK